MRLALAVLLCVVAALLFLRRDARSARPPLPGVVVEEPAAPSGRALQGTLPERQALVMKLTRDRDAAIAAIPELLEIVASGEIGWNGTTEPEPQLRLAAFELLESLGPDASPALPELLRWLEGDSAELIAIAAKLLGSLGKQAAPALPTILAILEDPQRRWSRGAPCCRVLENIGPEAAAAAPFLLEMIHESGVARRKRRERGAYCSREGEHVTATALAAMGDTGIEALIAGLSDPERDARWIAAWTLRKLTVAMPRLLDALSHPDPNVREGAALAIGESEAATDAVRDALVRTLSDPSAAVRREVSKHLARQGRLACPALVAALRDEDQQVQRNAVEGLRSFGADAREGFSDLVRLLKDEDDDTRAAAAAVLASMRGSGAEVVPLLVEALAEENDTTRERVAASVGRMGPAAVPALVTALGSADRKVRAAAARALRYAGDLDAPTRLHLRDRLADADDAVRVEAAATLAEPCALDVLEAGLVDPDHRQRTLAAEAIARMGAAAVGSLPALLGAERLHEKEFEEGKRDVFSKMSTDALRKAVVTVGAHDIPRLVAALGDGSDGVRGAALDALASTDFRIEASFAKAGPQVREQLVQVVLVRNGVNPDNVDAGDLAVVRRALRDADAHVRVTAAIVVWSRDKDARATLPVLVAALGEEPKLASFAAFWIAHIGKHGAFLEEELRAHARSPNDEVSRYVKQALAAIERDAAARR